MLGSPKSLKNKKHANRKIVTLTSNNSREGLSDKKHEKYLIDNIDKFVKTDFRIVYEKIYIWIDEEKQCIWVIEDPSFNGYYIGPKPEPPYNAWVAKKVRFDEQLHYSGCSIKQPFVYNGESFRSIPVFDALKKRKDIKSLDMGVWNKHISLYHQKPKPVKPADTTPKSGLVKLWCHVWQRVMD